MKGRFAAVLPAGGLGKRMGGNIPKQLMVLGGKPVYRYSLETFLSMDEIAEVVMAVPADWKDHFEKEIFCDNASEEIRTKMKIVVGGAERWQSVEKSATCVKRLLPRVAALWRSPPSIPSRLQKTVACSRPSTETPFGWRKPRRQPQLRC